MITIDYIVGDSIAAGIAINGFGLSRSGSYGEKSTDSKGISKVGANPDEVLKFLDEIGSNNLKSKNVILSTGISNSTSKIESVKKQLEFLKSIDSKVYVIGVSNTPPENIPGLIDMNPKLEELCKPYGFKFLGGFEPSSDKVHPSYSKYYEKNIKPVIQGDEIQTSEVSQSNNDNTQQAQTTPVESEAPKIDPDKVFVFNVEKDGFFYNIELGTFSIVPFVGEFEFTTEVDDIALDEEFIEEEFVGEEEELGIIRGNNPEEEKNNSKTEDEFVDDSNEITGSVIADIKVKDAIIKVMTILIKNGFSEEQAAAICGNIKAESGFKHWNIENGAVNIQPNGDGEDRWDKDKAKNKNYDGDKFSGWGLAQWTYGRRSKCERFVGKYLKDKGVSVKTLRQAYVWILDTDPGLHSGFDSKKPYLGGTDNSPLEKYLKTVPHLFDAQCEYLSWELKNNYAKIVNKLFNGISAGNTARLISAGAFINQSGGKPQKNIGAYTEAVLCDFEVPGSVSVVWNEPGQSSNKKYRKTAEERIKNAKDCLATWKSK